VLSTKRVCLSQAHSLERERERCGVVEEQEANDALARRQVRGILECGAGRVRPQVELYLQVLQTLTPFCDATPSPFSAAFAHQDQGI